MAQANVGCREWLGEGTSHIDMQEVELGVALLRSIGSGAGPGAQGSRCACGLSFDR